MTTARVAELARELRRAAGRRTAVSRISSGHRYALIVKDGSAHDGRRSPVADQKLIKAEPGTLIWTEPLPEGGRAFVKMYRRRPLLDPVRRWFTPFRVEREYDLLTHLYRNGVPCPEPLSWSHGTSRPAMGGTRLLVTREIPGTAPLTESAARHGRDDRLGSHAALRRSRGACTKRGVSHGAFYADEFPGFDPDAESA